ncbi:hypothetical protein LINPERHAP1_LOCUS14747, partial [Linum perenne]
VSSELDRGRREDGWRRLRILFKKFDYGSARSIRPRTLPEPTMTRLGLYGAITLVLILNCPTQPRATAGPPKPPKPNQNQEAHHHHHHHEHQPEQHHHHHQEQQQQQNYQITQPDHHSHYNQELVLDQGLNLSSNTSYWERSKGIVSPWHEIAAATANNGEWTGQHHHHHQEQPLFDQQQHHQMVWPQQQQHHHNVTSVDTPAANFFSTTETCSAWPSIHDQSGIPSSSSFMNSGVDIATVSHNHHHHHHQGGWTPSLTEQQFMQTDMISNTGWTPPPQTGGGSSWDPLLYVSSVLG